MDEFGAAIENYSKPVLARNQSISHNEPVIPTHAAEDLPPIASLEPAMRRLIESAKRLFKERPIWTRRALHNRVSAEDLKTVGLNSAKLIYQYLGYLFNSGPWRDAVVKYGVDPRKDPKLCIYQTMVFMLDKEENDKKKPKRSKASRYDLSKGTQRNTHIFDGKCVSLDGKTWQVCDITDPLLSSMLSTTSLRVDCHVRFPRLSTDIRLFDTDHQHADCKRRMVSQRYMGQGQKHHEIQNRHPSRWRSAQR